MVFPKASWHVDWYGKLLSLLENSEAPGGRGPQNAQRQLHGKYIPDRDGVLDLTLLKMCNLQA